MKTKHKLIIVGIVLLLIVGSIIAYRRNRKTELIEAIKLKFPNYQADETVMRKKSIKELEDWLAGDVQKLAISADPNATPTTRR